MKVKYTGENTKLLSNKNSINYGRKCDSESFITERAFSLRFVFSGSQNFEMGHRKLSVYPDSFLAITEGTSFVLSISSDKPSEFLSLNYDESYHQEFLQSILCPDQMLLDQSPKDILLCPYFHETLHTIKGDLKYNVKHLHRHVFEETHSGLLMEEYLYHCLLSYHHLLQKDLFQKYKRLEPFNPGTRDEIYRRVNLAKDYIFSNYNKPVELKEISTHSCLSVTHLLRSFKQVYGTTPHQLLIQTRLDRAKAILKNTDYPINEVVKLVGFDSCSSFVRLFRERFELTPLKYRNCA